MSTKHFLLPAWPWVSQPTKYLSDRILTHLELLVIWERQIHHLSCRHCVGFSNTQRYNSPCLLLHTSTQGKKDARSARDLGVRVRTDLRPRQQCILARNRANKILGFIGRCVINMTPWVILRLYLALDYACSPLPHLCFPRKTGWLSAATGQAQKNHIETTCSNFYGYTNTIV